MANYRPWGHQHCERPVIRSHTTPRHAPADIILVDALPRAKPAAPAIHKLQQLTHFDHHIIGPVSGNVGFTTELPVATGQVQGLSRQG